MFDSIIKKVVARNREREIVESSYEEMQQFILTPIQPDFDDETIIAVKFLVCSDESLDDADETSWFINPIYTPQLPELNFYEIEEELYVEPTKYFDSRYFSSIHPKLASEFLPELILIAPSYPMISVFQEYQTFRNELILTGLLEKDESERFDMFIEWLSKRY